jgi:hypothetical protein
MNAAMVYFVKLTVQPILILDLVVILSKRNLRKHARRLPFAITLPNH